MCALAHYFWCPRGRQGVCRGRPSRYHGRASVRVQKIMVREREKKHQRRGLIIGPMRLLTGRFHDRECPRGRQCVRDGRPSCYHGRESAPTPTFCHRTSLDTHRVEDCPGNRHAHPSPIARFTSIVRAPRPLDPIVHGTIRSLLWRAAAHAPIEPSPSSEPSDGLREGERKNR